VELEGSEVLENENMKNIKGISDEDGNETMVNLVSQITKWKIEASSNYNDGWTRKHYQEKLDALKSAIDKAYN